MRKNLGLAAAAVLAGITMTAIVVPVANATDAPVETTTKAAAATSTTAEKPVETTTSTSAATTTTTSSKATTTSKPPVDKPAASGLIGLGDLDKDDLATSTVVKGGHYRAAFYCLIGTEIKQPTDIHSGALNFEPSEPYKNIWVAKASVKDGVAPGSYPLTAKCGDVTISWSLELVSDPSKVTHSGTKATALVESKKAAVAAAPSGRIETGGGALAQG